MTTDRAPDGQHAPAPLHTNANLDAETEVGAGVDLTGDAEPDRDLAAALRAFAPALREPQLPTTDISYAVHHTPVGALVLAVRANGRLLTCSYDDEQTVTERLARAVSPRILRRPSALDGVRTQLDEYFAGHRRTIDVPIDLALATPFARRVLRGLADIPYAATTSYGHLADAIGAARASRAVGTALGSNPVCVVLPCHRVIRASGEPGGYAGGPERKEALLHLEQSSAVP